MRLLLLATLALGLDGLVLAPDDVVKLFDRHPRKSATNARFCVQGSYCSYAPNKIICSLVSGPQNATDALWRCFGTMESGYDLDVISVVCQGGDTEHDPRSGCVLTFGVTGPFTGWSWFATILFWTAIVFILGCFSANGGARLSAGAGAGRTSRPRLAAKHQPRPRA